MRLASIALVPVLASGFVSVGCDISAKPFAGTVIQMEMTGAQAQPANRHYELWARNRYNDVVRISGTYETIINNTTTRLVSYGFVIRPVATMDDPCMIDTATGALLTKAEAYKDGVFAGTPQTAEEQAQQVRSRIAQLTTPSSCDGSGSDPVYHCGHENATALGAIAYETVDDQGNLVNVSAPSPRTCETSGNAPGCIPFGAAPAERLAACNAYWKTNPLAYTPNPLQLTAPIHGQLYGQVFYATMAPVQLYNGFRIDSNVGLKGIQELWMTLEPDQVDGLHRGPIQLDATPGPGGRGVVHFDLTPPFGSSLTLSGAAALQVDLNEDPVQF